MQNKFSINLDKIGYVECAQSKQDDNKQINKHPAKQIVKGLGKV